MTMKPQSTQKIIETKTARSSMCPHCISMLIGNAVSDIENNQ